jgi:CheY-like chemotaxis protein
MMTSVNNRGDAKYFADIGFDAYFPKPTTTDDLSNALLIVAADGDALEQADPLVTHHYIKSLTDNEKHQKLKNDFPLEVKNSRILLVEDNVVNQMVATGMLNQLGFNADIAVDGQVALSSLREAAIENPYSLIFMDCQMPNMDGYETTRQIREGKTGEHNSTIPIIALTANAMKGDREKCLDSGMNDFISKPIDMVKIKEKLYKWLSK